MYDLNKIIIIGDYHLDDEEGLETVVMKTDGMKILDLLYINDRGFINDDKSSIEKELKSELYDDMYDDDLNIRIKEAYDGKDALNKVASFIDDIWDKDSLLYFYNAKSKCFNYLVKELEKYNGRIYLANYYDIFVEGQDMEKPITEIMKEQGLRVENMLENSTISFMYFLHGLVEKMINR